MVINNDYRLVNAVGGGYKSKLLVIKLSTDTPSIRNNRCCPFFLLANYSAQTTCVILLSLSVQMSSPPNENNA